MAEEWILGQPVVTQTVYEWILGLPHVVIEGEAGGETYIRTINDSLGVTDVVGRTQVQTRTIADGVGSVDNMGRTQAQLRTLAESLGITDALKKAETRIFTDAVAITDVITKSQAFARTIADDIGIVHNAGWFGVDSGNLDSHCGEGDGTQLAWALDGANRWFHWSEHPPEHWFILDLGTSQTKLMTQLKLIYMFLKRMEIGEKQSPVILQLGKIQMIGWSTIR